MGLLTLTLTLTRYSNLEAPSTVQVGLGGAAHPKVDPPRGTGLSGSRLID